MIEEDDALQREHMVLCASMNLEDNVQREAWTNYHEVKKNITLEGDQRHWLGCAIYVACGHSRIGSSGQSLHSETGNQLSLTSLLRHCDMTIRDFFRKCKKWVEWSELPTKFRLRVEHLERKFNVSMILYRKYRPIFEDIFNEPTHQKVKKVRSIGCSSHKLFEFGWTLFICLKSRVPDIAEDLVNSFHVLLAVCDLMFANVLFDDRKDLLNKSFPGLPEDFNESDYKPPTEPPCIVDLLSRRHNAISVEALFAKTYCMRPQIASLFDDDILSGIRSSSDTIILPQFFEKNLSALDKTYCEYINNVGDFDERVFLGEEANDDLVQPVSAPEREQRTAPIRRDQSSSNILRTPLSGKELLKDKESPCKSQAPLSSVTQSVRNLISLINGRTIGRPSDALLNIMREISPEMEHIVRERVETLCALVMSATSAEHISGNDTGTFSARRLDYATTLYYRIIENILAKEQTPDLKCLLERDIIHTSVFACCLEIVMYSYNSHRPFPWVIETLNIEPYYFYRVIEIIIRSEELLSRPVIKHLTMIEEHVLESLAWKSESPVWEQIRLSELPVPRCDEVSFSNQLLNENEMRRESSSQVAQQSSVTRPKLSERFSSPVSRVVRPGQSLLNTNYQPSSVGNAALTSSPTRNDPSQRGTQPSRTGSLALFFRKFYFLANVRMQDLCTRLEIVDVSLKRKIWTCFEYSIVNNTDLMQDRHLDQILMCAVYVMCRVLHTLEQPTSTQFGDILKMYRNQPQAESSVYRNVLLRKRTDTAQSSPAEERGNLIQFYNYIYMNKIQAHAREYAAEQRTEGRMVLPLSPLPRMRQVGASPPRKFGARIFMSPMDLCPPVGSFDDIDGKAISIHDSPAKDLQAINEKISKINGTHSAVKRIVEVNEDVIPSKQSRTIYRKLNDVMKDRSKQ